MPLPEYVSQTTVEGNYFWLDGTPAAGTVTFLPSIEYVLVAASGASVYMDEVTAILDINGHFSVPLVATDDADLNPTGWTYLVRVLLNDAAALPGQSSPVESIFSIYVPLGPPINLADWTPVQSSPGNAVIKGPPGDPGAVVSVNGQTDIVVLDADDVGAEPVGTSSTVQANLNAHVQRAANAHAASAISYQSGQAGIDSSTVQTAIMESKGYLDAHINSEDTVHKASAVSFVPSGTIAASTVQGAITEDSAELATHLADAVDAHDASAISFVPTGTIAATTVQAAVMEAANEAAGALTVHANKATGAHPAGAVAFTPTGSIASTEVQSALVEVASEAAGAAAAVNTSLNAHLNDSIAAHAASAVAFTPGAGIAATTVQQAILEDAGDLAAHLGDATNAHFASAVGFTPQAGITAATVQAAIVEDAGHLNAHAGQAAGAHPATAVSFAPTGSIAATTVQAAVAEVASEGAAATSSVATGLANHLADAVDAHDASAISFIPTGTIAATTVQAAVAEVSGDISGTVTGLSNHIADPIDAHDASAISLVDALGLLNANTVEDAIAEIVGALNAHGMWGDGPWAGGGGGGGTSVATATAVVSSQSPAVSGASVTITATVTHTGTPVTTGTVTFKEGTTTLAANVTVNSSGQATYASAALSVGNHTITATYNGATGFNASSGSVTQVISATGNAATVTAVASSQNPSIVGTGASITATVTSGGNPVSVGTVTFTEGATVLAANVTLSGAGVAVFSAVALTVATHTITATYSGGTGFNGSSGQINQVVQASGGSAPSAPQNLVATAAPIGVSLTWSLPAGANLIGGDPKEIASYNIEQSTNATTGFTLVATVAGGVAQPKLIYPLTAGVTYYFRVKAAYMVTPTGYSVPSNTASATPTAGPALPASWDAAVATNDLNAITLWYDANTGYDSEGVTFADLWGPGQTAPVTVDNAWLTANAGANVVLNAGRWTVSKLHAQEISVARDNVTLSHCLSNRPFANNQGGFGAVDNVMTGTPPTPSTTYRGIIVDHCTARGNFGDGTHNAFGDGCGYYNDTDHTADGMIVRNCDISGYRAGWLMFFGCTAQYNWVHDLYIWSDSHNTSHSIRGENCTIYRCLLTDGTSSAISCYADTNPYSKFYLVENILTTWGNALQEVNFPQRPPDYWNLLYDSSALGGGHVDGALLPSAFGYDRQLVGNRFRDGTSGDNTYFTKVSGNKKLSTGLPIFFDTGEAQVAHEPSLRQLKYYDYGNPVAYDQTYEFTPTPNSTLLVLVVPQNGGHATVPTPSVTAIGQYVSGQTFTKIGETNSDPVGDSYQCKMLLYKAPVGAQTSFQHIKVDFTGTGAAQYYYNFWVFEVTGSTGLTLVKYAPAIQHNPAFGGVLTTITSGNLSSAAANGNLVMAFLAGSSMTSPNTMGNQAGWFKIGTQPLTMKPGNFPNIVGATYWRKDFTGTNATFNSLGGGISPAALLLCEFSGA